MGKLEQAKQILNKAINSYSFIGYTKDNFWRDVLQVKNLLHNVEGKFMSMDREKIAKKVKHLRDTMIHEQRIMIEPGEHIRKEWALINIISYLFDNMNTGQDPDTLGECLTCGAKDGQKCYRHCGKRD